MKLLAQQLMVAVTVQLVLLEKRVMNVSLRIVIYSDEMNFLAAVDPFSEET